MSQIRVQLSKTRSTLMSTAVTLLAVAQLGVNA
jgi:hypothetical protein